MHIGKLVFAQLMDHLPWKSFGRIVERYGGDHRVREFSCANQLRCMAFAQLTYRERLRDITTCLRAQSAKLYHLGIRGAVARSTLADANEARDWRIYKLHTLIDLRGNIPSFIHISEGKLHDVNVLDILLPEPGAFYVMDRGYLDFERLHRLHLAGAFFVTRAKSNLKAKRCYARVVERSTGLICDQTLTLTVFYSKTGYPEALRRIRFKTQEGKTLVFLTNNFALPALTITELYRCRANPTVFIYDEHGDESEAMNWMIWYTGYSIEDLIQKFFPWTDADIDADLYEENEEIEQEVSLAGNDDDADESIPIDHSMVRLYTENGETATYRFALSLNEIGKSYLKLGDYLSEE